MGTVTITNGRYIYIYITHVIKLQQLAEGKVYFLTGDKNDDSGPMNNAAGAVIIVIGAVFLLVATIILLIIIVVMRYV